LLILVCLVTPSWHPVYAHFNTKAPDTDVQLHWPVAGSSSMSVDVKILTSPESKAAIYWGHQFQFANNETGYITMGIGGSTKVASFGIFDSIQGVPNNSSGVCDNVIGFLSTGIGSACYLMYQWSIGYDYRLKVSRIADANGSEQWQGSIYDYSSNSTSIIGNILVDQAYGQLGMVSSTWDEYAYYSTCNTPLSKVVFSYPNASGQEGSYGPSKAQVTYGNSTCQDSNVNYLGGGAYEADAGMNVSRTTAAEAWLWTQEPTLVSQNQVAAPEFPFSTVPFLGFVLITAVMIVSRIQRGKN